MANNNFRLPTSLGVAVAIVMATASTPGAVNAAAATAKTNQPAIVAATARADNAAPLYRRAIQMLEADPALLDLHAEAPLDDTTAQLLNRAGPILDLMKQAAALPVCEWPEPYELAETTTLGKLRNLAGVGVLQARRELARQRYAAAVDELLAVMALGRHVGQMPVFISKLVEIGVSEQATAHLARALPDLPKDLVASLPAKLDALPRSATFGQTILGEHAYALEATRKIRAAGARAGAGFDAAAIRQAMPWYVAVADAATLPPDEFAAAVDTELTKLPDEPSRGFAMTLVPVVKPLRVPTAQLEAHEAMLRTAAEIVANGEKAVEASRDPFGTGPFEYRKLPRGFELTSALKTRGKRVTLTVGT